ncbi:MAG: DUF4373 domain-containing protein [Phycisphaerae bacterium]|jgi:hypothetical protein
MARLNKVGLDYFPLDTICDDKSFRLLKAKYGAEGVGVLVLLWQRIYRNGYYCKWDEDESMLFSQENSIPHIKLKEIIEFMVEKNLFNEDLFKNNSVLTSTGVQNRYLDICVKAKRQKIVFDKRLCLIKSKINDINSEEKKINSEIIIEDSGIIPELIHKVKESKVKESKEDTPLVPSGTDPHQDLYDYYNTLGLTKHKSLTKEMRNAIDKARRMGSYSWDELKILLERHVYVVKLTEGNGDWKVHPRGIREFFGQKVKDGTGLICSEYADDGAKWLKYKDGNPENLDKEWEKVIKTLNRYGPDGKEKAYKELGPKTSKIIEDIGGYCKLYAANNENQYKGDFEKEWRKV